ncbi:2'-5' RNA ligase family protein [Streptomyces sp. NPDC056716]|uniref:2'-5' RNA ligase family protein n=1 Tax=unclassified Streptomyces TaxID=2593676 RepID=UPI0036B69DFB
MTGVEDFFVRVESRRHPWPAGRDDLHWHILHDTAAVEERMVRPYRELTDRPGLAPVPARWVHTTVMHGGPADLYTDEEITTIIERVSEASAAITSFDLTYDRPTAGTVAVECLARPGISARRLWELITRIDADTTGRRFARIPAENYYPHVSLAYGIGGPARADRRAMKAWLSDHAGDPCTLPATHLSLVAQRHDRRHITWSPIAVIPLTAGQAEPARPRAHSHGS